MSKKGNKVKKKKGGTPKRAKKTHKVPDEPAEDKKVHSEDSKGHAENEKDSASTEGNTTGLSPKKIGKASDLADEKLDTLPTKKKPKDNALPSSPKNNIGLKLRQAGVDEHKPAQAGGMTEPAEPLPPQVAAGSELKVSEIKNDGTEKAERNTGVMEGVIIGETIRGVRGDFSGPVEKSGQFWIIVSRPARNIRCTGCGKLIETKYIERNTDHRTLALCRSCALVHMGQRLGALNRGVLPYGKDERKYLTAAVEAMGAKIEPVPEEADK